MIFARRAPSRSSSPSPSPPGNGPAPRRLPPSAATHLARIIWLCVLPLTVLAAWLALDQVLTLKETRAREARALSRAIAEAVERRLGEVSSALRTLAASPLVDDGRFDALYVQATGVRQAIGTNVILADRDRRMLLNTRVPYGTPLPPVSPENDAVVPAIEHGRSGVSRLVIGPVSGKPTVTLVVPVRREEATPYVLIATMDPAEIQRAIERLPLGPGWVVRVFDRNGKILAQQPVLAERIGARVPDSLLAASAGADVEAGPVAGELSDGGSAQEYLSRPQGVPWTVALAIPDAHVLDPLLSTGLTLAGLIAAIALAVAAAGRLTVGRLARSIAALASGADDVSSGVREIDEIRDVLRERDAHWRHFIEVTPHIAWTAGADGRVLDLGPRWSRLTGLTPDGGPPEWWGNAVHPEDRPRLARAWARALADGTALDEEARIRTAEGGYRWMRSRAYPRRGAEGRVMRWYGLTEDVHDRREAEHALRESSARLAAIVSQAAAGIAQADPDGRFVLANDRFCEILGRSRDDLLSRTIREVTAPEDWAGNAVQLDRMVAGGEPFAIDKRYLRGDGTPVWVNCHVSAMLDADGRLNGILAVVFDLTERRAMEGALLESNEQFRRTVENAPFPVMVHAEDGEIIHLSRAWLEAAGYAREDIPTLAAWADRAFPDPQAARRIDLDRLFALDRPVDEGEATVRTADGRARIWAFRSSPIGRDGRGRRMAVTMAADLTERKEAEARLRLLMNEVDHRAKNALTVVQSIVRLSRAEDPADFAEAVQGRVAAMARAHTLLSSARWSGADLAALVTEELGTYATTQRICVLGPAVAITAEAAQAVSMVLHELTTNAAKYGALAAPGGRVDVTWRREGGSGLLLIDWLESGGPPVQAPERHGFGTQLLRRTVREQLHGEIVKHWEPGGLVCRVTLPRDCYLTSGVCGPSPLPAPEPVAGRAAPADGARVLVVEDEALTALALAQVLQDARYEVIGPVGRVQEAIDLARARPPDVAVLDVNLFGQPSFPVAEALDAMGVPFLFCTGYGSLDTADERMRRAPLLTKPVSPSRLAGALAALLARGYRSAGEVAPAE